MSIKTRLLLSYIAMIVVPVILFGFVASILASFLLGEMAGSVKDTGKPVFWEPYQQREELFSGVKFMAQYDPDRLRENGLLEKTDEPFARLNAALIVEKNGTVIFASSSLSHDEIREYMAGGTTPAQRGWRAREGELNRVETYDFAFTDGSKGRVYFLSDPRPFFSIGKYFVLSLVLSLLVIIGLTNGILTYLVSRSIIRPLYALKRAAEDIKEGNLDRPVHVGQKGEMGELGAAFEEMRGRLHESIRLQLQYEENRKELISSISHDLKTPLMGIQACVEAMKDGIADTEQKRDKYIQMIATKSEQMNHMIDELFLFSKLDLNKLPFHLEKINLVAFLTDFVEELRQEPRMSGVRVKFSVADGQSLSVMADREKLRRAVMNIVDNSLKYMEKADKRICVKVDQDGDEGKVIIEDNGTGIDPIAIPHIFEQFYRADPSRNTSTGGSGLGLAIVKQIVEAHGGRVWASSQPGEGTLIGFALPKSEGGEQ
jgi:signal transduction histidine kinase